MVGATKKNERTYVAITHQQVNQWTHRPDFYIVTIGKAGESKESVTEVAERDICGDQWNQAKDIYTDTALKNLFVVTESAAKRSYKTAYNHWLEQEINA